MKRMIKLIIAFWLMCGAAQAQTPNNTDLYIKLPDASGFEDNSYVPEMNKFVEDMIKTLPLEYQSSKFKVYEMGCYSPYEYTTGGYKEQLKLQKSEKVTPETEYSIIFGKRCVNGTFDELFVDVELPNGYDACLSKDLPNWKEIAAENLKKVANDEHLKNKLDPFKVHLAIKAALTNFKETVAKTSVYCKDFLGFKIAQDGIIGLDSKNRSATVDLSKPFYMIFGHEYYALFDFGDFGKEINIIYSGNGGLNGFGYKGEVYQLTYNSDGYYALFNENDLSHLTDFSIDSYGNKVSNYSNLHLQPIRRLNDELYKNGTLVTKEKDLKNIIIGDAPILKIEKTGRISVLKSQWLSFLQTFNGLNNNPENFELIKEFMSNVSDAQFEDFLYKKLQGSILGACQGGASTCDINGIDLGSLAPIFDAPCQSCILQKFVDAINEKTQNATKLWTEIQKLEQDVIQSQHPVDIATLPYTRNKMISELYSNLSPLDLSSFNGNQLKYLLSYLTEDVIYPLLGLSESIRAKNTQNAIALLDGVNGQNLAELVQVLQQKIIKTVSDFDGTIIHGLFKHCPEAQKAAFIKVCGNIAIAKNPSPMLSHLLPTSVDAEKYNVGIGNIDTNNDPVSIYRRSYTAEVEESTGKIRIGRKGGICLDVKVGAFCPNQEEYDYIIVNPLDLVQYTVYDAKAIPLFQEALPYPKRETFIMPTIFCVYTNDEIFRSKVKDGIQTGLFIAVDIATLATGLGELNLIISGIKQTKNIIKAVELANSAANLYLNTNQGAASGNLETFRDYSDGFLMFSAARNVFSSVKAKSAINIIEETSKVCAIKGRNTIKICKFANPLEGFKQRVYNDARIVELQNATKNLNGAELKKAQEELQILDFENRSIDNDLLAHPEIKSQYHDYLRSGLDPSTYNSLLGKLKFDGYNRVKHWLELHPTAKQKELLEELEKATNGKAVKDVFIDQQGRMSCVIDRPGQTYKVITMHPINSGSVKLTIFDPAYNPALNPSIAVPLSKNGLVPNYAGTQYMHPLQGSTVVRIKMAGNRSTDFIRARAELKISIADEQSNLYTWHHMDDFEIINGEAYCTMQLVQKTVHQGTGVLGMAHSGSASQWRAYFNSGY